MYDYKDHGFAIDHAEADSVFGHNVVVRNSPEYEFANEAYELLEFYRWFLEWRFGCDFAYTGALGSGAWVRPRPR